MIVEQCCHDRGLITSLQMRVPANNFPMETTTCRQVNAAPRDSMANNGSL
jgi:hypothetical protein